MYSSRKNWQGGNKMPDNSRNNRNIKHSQKRKANVRKVNKNSSKRPINDEEENIPKALRKNKEDQTSIDYEELNKMADTFLARGFTYFDTAWMYMGYESEIAIRKSLVERYPRDKYTVASKMPIGYLKKPL